MNVYDTGEHRITGFSQQQSGDQSLTFTSQLGLVRVADLPLVNAENHVLHDPSVAGSLEPAAPAAAPALTSTDDILTTIERLSDLRQKNILTETEFAAKKAELLSRL